MGNTGHGNKDFIIAVKPHAWRRAHPVGDLFTTHRQRRLLLLAEMQAQARPDAPASVLEQKEYDFLTKKVLVRPPRVPLEEGAIEIRYVQLAPEAKQMFEWAHILHRQIYDVWADERIAPADKDARVAELQAFIASPDAAHRPKVPG